MEQSTKNLSGLKDKKRGHPVAVTVMIAILAATALIVCRGVNASASNSYNPSVSPSISETALKLANTWAEAVKNRDGKAQYALYTRDLQKKLYNEYAGLNWVTGTSSPGVGSYIVALTESGANVTFKYVSSTGPAGDYTIHLEWGKEDNILKIRGIYEPETAQFL